MQDGIPFGEVLRKFIGYGLQLEVAYWFVYRLRERILSLFGEDVRSPPQDLLRDFPKIDFSPPADPRSTNTLPASIGVVAAIAVAVAYQLSMSGFIVVWTAGTYQYLGTVADVPFLMGITILLSLFVALQTYWSISERIATSPWYLGW